jgi:hypothetical protein
LLFQDVSTSADAGKRAKVEFKDRILFSPMESRYEWSHLSKFDETQTAVCNYILILFADGFAQPVDFDITRILSQLFG